jgi:hypothetical protein
MYPYLCFPKIYLSREIHDILSIRWYQHDRVSNHFIIDLKLSQFFPNWLNFFKEEDFPSSKLHFHYHY